MASLEFTVDTKNLNSEEYRNSFSDKETQSQLRISGKINVLSSDTFTFVFTTDHELLGFDDLQYGQRYKVTIVPVDIQEEEIK